MTKKVSIIGLLMIWGIIIIHFFLNHLYLYSVMVIGIALFFYIIGINNQNKRESLNIRKNNNEFSFYLSDDLLYKIEISKDKKFYEKFSFLIEYETSMLEDIIDKVNFINFKNDLLLNKANRYLHKRS